MGNNLEILRWRHTTALGPERPFFETEVTDGMNRYYVSLSVNFCVDKERITEDNHWGYVCPLDKVDFANDGKGQMAEDIDFSAVLRAMIRKWNKHPVFSEDGWHDWRMSRRLIRLVEADVDGCGTDAELLLLVEDGPRISESVIENIKELTTKYKAKHRYDGWDSDELFDIAADRLRSYGYTVAPLPFVKDIIL